jgi:hypothetical protein
MGQLEIAEAMEITWKIENSRAELLRRGLTAIDHLADLAIRRCVQTLQPRYDSLAIPGAARARR